MVTCSWLSRCCTSSCPWQAPGSLQPCRQPSAAPCAGPAKKPRCELERPIRQTRHRHCRNAGELWGTEGNVFGAPRALPGNRQRFISRAFSSAAWRGAGPCGCGEAGADVVAVGPAPSTEPPAPAGCWERGGGAQEPPDVVLPSWASGSPGSVLTRGPCRAGDASAVRHAAFLHLCGVLAGFACRCLARCLQPGAPLPPAPCCAVFCGLGSVA